MEHCLKQLKKMIQRDEVLNQDHFHDEYLSLFILSNDFRLKHSFHSLKSYYISRKSHPEFFWPPSELIKLFYDNFPCAWLSPATSPSINLLIVSFSKWDTGDENIKLVHFLSSILVSLQVKLLMNPFRVSRGVNIIFDFNQFNWKHFQEVDVQPFRKVLQFIDESLPIKLIRIICINMNHISNTLMALIKPFLGGNIRRKLIVIDCNPLIDPEEEIVEEGKYSKLHKLIPPGHLPVDYNGYYSVIHVLTANLIHDLIKYESSILNHWNKDLMVTDRRTVSNEGRQDGGMLERLDEEAERMDREDSKNEVMMESKRKMETIKDRRIEERMITIEIEREEEEIEEYDLNNNNLK